MATAQVPYRQIRAFYDRDTVTVYQAYQQSIAEAAVKHQKLNASPDFKSARMTWVKPSWAWMMYRAGYSYKDAGQARILALRMKHEHFVALLERGVLATHNPEAEDSKTRRSRAALPGDKKTSEVRIQWDPERSPALKVLPYRSIQIGIPGAFSSTWVTEWIVSIEDVTEVAQRLKKTIDAMPDVSDEELLGMGCIFPELPYEVNEALRRTLCMDATG